MYASGRETLRLAAARTRPGRSRRFWRGLLGLAAATGLGCSLALAAGSGAGAGEYASVVVAPGDTVWTIAAQRYPASDTRARVAAILRANHLSEARIQPGEALLVPSR